MDDRFTEFPGVGRCFAADRRVRLGDLDRQGRLRFDAVARYAQDVASDDAVDGALHAEDTLAWVIRRTAIVCRAPATYRERLELRTWCSGVGSRWAERRTSIRGAAGAAIDVVSLWVQLDAATGAPRRLDETFHELWGASAEGRQVSSRLLLPTEPPPEAEQQDWPVRRADLDPLGHVNNAATWAAVEEAAEAVLTRLPVVATLEYRAPIESEQPVALVRADDGDSVRVWLLAGDRAAAVALVEPAD